MLVTQVTHPLRLTNKEITLLFKKNISKHISSSVGDIFLTLGEGVVSNDSLLTNSVEPLPKKTWALRHLNKFHNLYIKPNIPQRY